MTDITLTRTHKDGNLQIFQNQKKTVVFTHYSVCRGGCLYIGTIRIVNRETQKSIEFDTSSPPYSPENSLVPDNDECALRYFEALVRKHTM